MFEKWKLDAEKKRFTETHKVLEQKQEAQAKVFKETEEHQP